MSAMGAAWRELGEMARAEGRFAAAGAAYRQADVPADDLHAQLLRAAATIEEGEAALLIATLDDQAAALPECGALRVALGFLHLHGGAPERAIDDLEIATALMDWHALPHALLGAAYMETMRRGPAAAAFRAALARHPGLTEVENNLGAALIGAYRFAEAEAVLVQAAGRADAQEVARADAREAGAQDLVYLLCNLCAARSSLGDQDGAVAAATRALALDPACPAAHRALCNALPYREGTTGAEMRAALETFAAILPAAGPAPGADPASARAPASAPPFANVADPHRKLRIGLLSNSLKTHPVGWLTVAGIEALDRDAFELHCFGNQSRTDAFARRFAARSAGWHAIEGLDDAALAARIRAEAIDILIDCGGYGDAGRLAACRHRAAPVQAKWVGSQYHGTGLPEMDGFITDPRETPPGFEQFYTEALIRLPDGYVCYAPPAQAPDVGPLPALRNGGITFGCLNNLMKVGPGVLDAWAAILHRVPRSRLLIRAVQFSEPEAAERITAAFGARGIGAARLTLLGRAPHAAFIGTYNAVDIALDPFPYVGGLSTCEALFMGAPVLTLAGELFAGRHSMSHIVNAGLPAEEFVAASVPDYIEKAVALAADTARLAALRAALRPLLLASPLCDAPRFARNLDAALRALWAGWCGRRDA